MTDRWIACLFLTTNAGKQSMSECVSVCVCLNSLDSGFVFLGTINHNRNEIKASAGIFSPKSLHITLLSLLSRGDIIPVHICKHAHTRTHACTRTHPHTNINLLTALTEWVPAVPYLSSCCLFRIQLGDKSPVPLCSIGVFKSCIPHAKPPGTLQLNFTVASC